MRVEFSPAGATLLSVGGPPSGFLRVVASGGVRVSLPAGQGGEVEVDYRSTGAAIGYLSLFSGERSRVNVTAVEDTACYLIPWEPFHALLERRPEIREFFTRTFLATYLDKAFSDLRAASLTRRDGERLLFTTTVGELVRRDPVSAPAAVSVRRAAQVMARHRVSSLVLTGDGGEPVAIVTDRDLRERVAAGRGGAAPVAGIMRPLSLTAAPGDTCFDALLAMLRGNVHHLPVIESGRCVGMVTNHDLMLLQGNSPISLVREIEHQRHVEGLARAARQVDGVIDVLLREGAKAANVSRVTTEINDRLVRKALELVARPLGPAPLPWCWIVFGSEGRREQTFKTDQDNAIVHADAADPALAERARAWFAAFAPAARDALERCGFPPCPAGFTAGNPEWVRPLRAWKRAFTEWITTPTPEAVLRSLIFFDFRPLDDAAGLGAELRAHLAAEVADNPAFLGFVAAQIVRNPPPLGFLQRFVVEREGEHKDRLNLKIKAIAPIVDLARLFALERGAPETGTLDRLRALRKTHTIVASYGEELEQAFEFLLALRLHHQHAQAAAGRAPDNFIDPDSLSALERKTAREAFGLVTKLQRLVITRYRASIL